MCGGGTRPGWMALHIVKEIDVIHRGFLHFFKTLPVDKYDGYEAITIMAELEHAYLHPPPLPPPPPRTADKCFVVAVVVDGFCV